jgi:hypothetical protein
MRLIGKRRTWLVPLGLAIVGTLLPPTASALVKPDAIAQHQRAGQVAVHATARVWATPLTPPQSLATSASDCRGRNYQGLPASGNLKPGGYFYLKLLVPRFDLVCIGTVRMWVYVPGVRRRETWNVYIYDPNLTLINQKTFDRLRPGEHYWDFVVRRAFAHPTTLCVTATGEGGGESCASVP